MIGISIGSLNTIVGILKELKIDVILSDTAERTTPVLVNYDDKERTIGNRALTTIKRNIKQSFNYLTRYLGIKPSNTARLIEEAKYSLNAPSIDLNGDISFEINYKNNKDFYTPESLLGLFFSKLKLNWFKEGYQTNDVVVSVPDYFDITERQGMLDALSIANLKCVSLINESSAIALSYGLLRQKELHETEKKVVGFIDMGQSKLNVFYCSFTKSHIKVLSVTSERSCGGREMDYLLSQHLASIFEKKYGCNPMTNQKSRLRLMQTVAKSRKQLTVNSDVTISIDCLMEGEDLSYLLTRNEFISIVAPVIEKYSNVLKASIQKFQNETQMSINDLHSIEMAGDCVRTPVLQTIVKDLFNKELSKRLLPDECISRGCVLFYAMNNPFITMKKFTFEHYNSNVVYLDYINAENEPKQMVLFAQGENIPSQKSITFSNKQIKVNANCNADPNANANGDAEINDASDKSVSVNVTIGSKKNKGDYKIDLMTSLEDNDSLTIYAELNQNGIWNIAQCKLFNSNSQCKVISSKKDNQTMLESLIQRERIHSENDKDFIRISNRRNEIEKFLYSIRDKLSSDLSAYITLDEKNQFSSSMDSFVDWLYSGDESVNDLNQLEPKYNEITSFFNVIQARFNNWIAIEQKVKMIEGMMQKTETKANEVINRKRKQIQYSELKHINSVLLYAKKRFGEIKEILNMPHYNSPTIDIEGIEKEMEEINKSIEDEVLKLEKKRSNFFSNSFTNNLFDDGLF